MTRKNSILKRNEKFEEKIACFSFEAKKVLFFVSLRGENLRYQSETENLMQKEAKRVSFISLECSKRKRKKSHFALFHFEAKICLKQNRCTLDQPESDSIA
jgi:hypothetical protein